MKANYERVTWLFVSRNFKDDEVDREAARIHDRFGISSWPQLVLFDPRDDKVLEFMPRTLDAWVRVFAPHEGAVPKPTPVIAAAAKQWRRMLQLADKETAKAREVAAALAKEQDDAGYWLAAAEFLRAQRDGRTLEQRLADPDARERSLAIEAINDAGKSGATKWQKPLAARLLDDQENIVVRIRALHWSAQHQPEVVAEHAASLLQLPSDAFRYKVLEVVAAHPNPALAPLLAKLFAGAGTSVPSRNPNVLRGHVAKCIGTSGDASAVDAVAPLIREASARNGTTRTTINALAELAPRVDDKDRDRITRLLLEGLPPALTKEEEKTDARLVAARVKELHTALATASGKKLPAPPKDWSIDDRTRFVAAVRKAID